MFYTVLFTRLRYKISCVVATSSIYSNLDDSLLIREAQVADCPILAEFINESAEGAIDYLFSDLNFPIQPIVGMGHILEQEIYYSFTNSIVAECEGKVIGMVLCFPSDGLVISQQMSDYYSKEKLQYIRYFVDNKIENCWHLDALCVKKEFRDQGVGSKLLNAVKDKARDYKFTNIGVFVFGSNVNAIRFYERHGFILRKKINTAGHAFLGSRKSLNLMECLL